MASIETGAPSAAPTAAAPVKWSSKLTRYVSNSGAAAVNHHRKVDVALRAFLFATTLIAVVVMITSKQTTTIRVSPVTTIDIQALFTHSPSFTYFVAAFSVTTLYSIFTGYSSYSALKKQQPISVEHQLHMVLLDSVMLGIDAAATGAAGGVAYEALKGNPHIRWMKICHIFDTFCHHLAASGAMSLLVSGTLLLLVWLSVCSLARNALNR